MYLFQQLKQQYLMLLFLGHYLLLKVDLLGFLSYCLYISIKNRPYLHFIKMQAVFNLTLLWSLKVFYSLRIIYIFLLLLPLVNKTLRRSRN
nr:MAG TPA: hypothetical protein [Caudoviricetes sp.]